VRVVCAGHVNWDVTLRVDRLPEPDGEARIVEQRQSGGGSAANAAVVLAGLGADSAVVGSVGADESGWLARRELVDAGVDCTSLVETGAGTATKYLVVDADGEVMVLGNDGGNEAFAADDVAPDRLGRADHLHLTSQRPTTAAELAAVVDGAGGLVSFDPGRRVGPDDYPRTFERADLLFLTDREAAAALSGDRSGTVLVVKHGPDGAEVRAEGRRYTHPGYEVDAVDTAGAGDAFAAGFLAALHGDWSLPGGATDAVSTTRTGADGAADTAVAGDYASALVVANACGALAAGRTGARARLTRSEVTRFLRDR
jgi:ribokinase